MRRMVLNETSYFGWGVREILIDELKRKNYKRVLVVTDETLISLGISEKVISILDQYRIEYEIFSEIKPNPTVKNVKKGVKVAKKYHCDCMVAIGGGSVIDTAKAIGIVSNNPDFADVVSLCGVADTKNASIPIIALPTTAGTAAEVTINYVITDEGTKTKMVCVDPKDIPIVSIIDTELMAAMPASIAASTGMDALTHAIEGYLTKGSFEMTDMFTLEAMKLIYENIEGSVAKDRDAMEKMAMAQYIAGMGFSNAGLGIVHSMAHQLGALYDTPHGVANALLLPYVLEFNGKACPDKYRKMAETFNLKITDKTDEEIVQMVVDAIRALAIRLNIPQHIKDIGGNEEDIKELADKALKDPCTPGNPRDVEYMDLERLFRKAF